MVIVRDLSAEIVYAKLKPSSSIYEAANKQELLQDYEREIVSTERFLAFAKNPGYGITNIAYSEEVQQAKLDYLEKCMMKLKHTRHRAIFEPSDD